MLNIGIQVDRLAAGLPPPYGAQLRDAFASIDARTFQELVETAKASEGQKGVSLAWAIPRLRGIAEVARAQALVVLAQVPDAAVRAEALRGLAILDPEHSFPLALDLLKIDKDDDVRAAAVYLLGSAGAELSEAHGNAWSPATKSLLEGALRDALTSLSEHPFVRGMAAEAIGRAGLQSPQTLRGLRKALRSTDKDLIFWAADALGALRDRDAIEDLRAALSRPLPRGVQAQLRDALRMIESTDSE